MGGGLRTPDAHAVSGLVVRHSAAALEVFDGVHVDGLIVDPQSAWDVPVPLVKEVRGRHGSLPNHYGDGTHLLRWPRTRRPAIFNSS